jgi:hypothetical protein
MVNLSALDNIAPFVLNSTVLENIEETIPRTVENVNVATNGAFGIWISLMFFLIITIALFRKDQDIRLDIIRTLFMSTGLTTIVMLIMTVSGLVSTIKPLLWYMTIFILLAMLVQYLRSKNKL